MARGSVSMGSTSGGSTSGGTVSGGGLAGELSWLRDRLYESYASQHSGQGSAGATRLIYERDIRPLLPPPPGPVADIGCGSGQLVRCLAEDGYDALGIDVSPEQVALARAAGLSQVREGDYLSLLAGRRGQLAAVTATDLLEHLTKPEVLATFDAVAAALRTGGQVRRPGAERGQPVRRAHQVRRLHPRDLVHRAQRAATRRRRRVRPGPGHRLPAARARDRERRPRGDLGTGQRADEARARGRDGQRARAHRDTEPDLRRGQVSASSVADWIARYTREPQGRHSRIRQGRPGLPGAARAWRARALGSGLIRSMASTAGFNIAVTATAALGGVVIARAVGPGISGEYSAVTSWLGIVLMVAGLGQPLAVCFYVARDHEHARDYVATSARLMLATGVAAAVAGLALAPLLARGHPGMATAYRLAFAGTIVSCAGSTYLFALLGRTLPLWNRARMIQPGVALAGVAVLWRLHALTLDTTVEVLLGSLLAQLGWTYAGCRRARLAPGRFTATLVRPLAGYGIGQIAALAPASVNAFLDQLVLSVAVPPADLGRYSVAVSITLLPSPLVSAIGYVLMPALAATRAAATPGNATPGNATLGTAAQGTGAAARPAHTRATLTRAILASAGLAAAILAPIAAIAPWLVPFIFGGAYRGAVPLLWLLTPGGIFLACGQVVANVLRGLGRQGVVARAEGLAVVFTVVMLGSLVPVMGVTGAAIASTVPYGVSLALMMREAQEIRGLTKGAL